MMQSFFELVSDGALFDSTLVQAAVRSLALAAVVGAGLLLFRVRCAHHQLTAWTAVLLIAVSMPLLMKTMVISVPADPLPSVTIPAVLAAAPEFPDATIAPEPFALSARDIAEPGTDGVVVTAVIYGAVAAFLLLRLVVGLVLTARLRARAERLTTVWTGDSDVRVSDAIRTPVTVGETILLPSDHTSWAPEKRRAVLLHERSHVSRGDFYVQVLAAAHRAVFWFSPMAWWLNAKIAELAEHASDTDAIKGVETRAEYAAVLLDFAQVPAARFRVAPVAVAMARPAAVRERIERVLSGHAAVSRVRRGARFLVAGLVIVCGLAAAISVVETPANAAAGIDVVPVPSATVTPPAVLVPPAATVPPVPPIPPVEVDTHGAGVGGPPLHDWAPPVRVDIPEIEIPSIDVDVDIDMDRVQDALAKARDIEARVEARIARVVQRAEAAAERMDAASTVPSGPPVQETRDVGAFDGVSFGGSGKVFITIGPKTSVVLEGDAATLKRTKTDVNDDGVLRIRQRGDDDAFWGRSTGIVVRITVPKLESARVSGSGDLKVSGLNGGETTLSISGSGSIEADGKLQALALAISGSGNANMQSLVTNDANVAISGSGSALLDVREGLNVRVSGSGSVRYLTQPKDVNTSISGSGSVRRRDAT